MAESDYLQFENGRGALLCRAPWVAPPDLIQPWPPPERLGLLCGKSSGRPHLVVVGPQGEAQAREHVQAQGKSFDEHFEIRRFVRCSASKITEEQIQTMTHVARGALYTPEAP